jgi:hypothetical protein
MRNIAQMVTYAYMHNVRKREKIVRQMFKITREEYVKLYLPAGAVKVADKQSNAVAYLYNAKHNGKPAACIFLGKSDKPYSRHYYANEKGRESAVASAFEGQRRHDERVAESRKARTSWVPTYQVGDVFHTSWGYDQTNVEYFQIIEIKGKYATLREIGCESEDTGWMTGKSAPIVDKFLEPRYEGDDRGKPIRRLMQERGIKIDDVRWAWLMKPTKIAGCKVYGTNRWSSYA